jgi:hypothetical protein
VLPVDRRSAYAAGVAPLIAPGGSLIVVAHAPGAERGTQAVTADELRALFPGFELVRTMTTALSGAAAQLFELQRTEALR